MESLPSNPPGDTRRLSWLQVAAIVLVSMLLTVALTLWLVKVYLFPAQFTPVTLTPKEERALAAKLETLDPRIAPGARSGNRGAAATALEREPYSEVGASREIRFSEREINALLAKNTDLAQRVAIDLADDLISAKILVPLDEDFPILGGQIVRVNAGVEFAYLDERPVVRLKGISIMGVPLPNAWLGGLKNIDLVQEYGTGEGFWKAFAEGVAAVRVQEGQLMLRLKE
jgi:hypothetical protein